MRTTFKISGYEYDGNANMIMKRKAFNVMYTKDQNGCTLSIDNGEVQFTIPFDKIAALISKDKRYARN